MVIKTSPLNHSELNKKYGMNRAKLYHAVCNTWNLWDTDRLCKLYKYAELTPSQFFLEFNTENGMLYNNHVDKYFNIIYQFCTPEQCKKASKLKLSFRIAKDDFNIEPIVLVQIKRECEK